LSGKIRTLRNPSNTDSGMRIKKEFERGNISNGNEAAKIFALDRKELHDDQADKFLSDNDIVIYDRYLMSSVVHQSAQGVSFDQVMNYNSEVPLPNINSMLIPNAYELRRRLLSRNEIHEEKEIQILINNWIKNYSLLKLDWEPKGCRMISIESKNNTKKTSAVLASKITYEIIDICLKRSISNKESV
jgi:thymidylate kinase